MNYTMKNKLYNGKLIKEWQVNFTKKGTNGFHNGTNLMFLE